MTEQKIAEAQEFVMNECYECQSEYEEYRNPDNYRRCPFCEQRYDEEQESLMHIRAKY